MTTMQATRNLLRSLSDRAIDQIVRALEGATEQHLTKGQLDIADALIRNADASALGIGPSVAVLTVTLPLRDRLPSRAAFHERVSALPEATAAGPDFLKTLKELA